MIEDYPEQKYKGLDICLKRPRTNELSKCPECYKETGKWVVFEIYAHKTYDKGTVYKEVTYPHLCPLGAQQALCSKHGDWKDKPIRGRTWSRKKRDLKEGKKSSYKNDISSSNLQGEDGGI